jgi:MoaA/NifB/PqqE/SkfB family radical SAM enzyme
MTAKDLLTHLPTGRLFQTLISNNTLRHHILEHLRGRLEQNLFIDNPDNCPTCVQQGKYDYLWALLRGLDRAIERDLVSKHVLQRLIDVFLDRTVLNRNDKIHTWRQEKGFVPPMFVLLSPTGCCNLRCTGCYAGSDPTQNVHLPGEIVDRILTEKEELWDSYFTVISGGEPMMWRDGDRTILDVIEDHPDGLFLLYTNGTLLTDEVAARMAELGNVTPAISVEGFEAETDARRGTGVHKKVMEAFERLRKHGVPFGISATPTRENWRTILSDEFVDFYFHKQGAFYGWLFQYMPIGRGQSLELMVPAEERVEMLHQTERIVREHEVFLADFWNSGHASSGCISAGREGGYFYIDWHGDASPCVFMPYAADNVHDLYARGENLNDLLEAPLFRNIRQWQSDHGFERNPSEVENWLCPCPIRDHHPTLRRTLEETGAKPINDEAAAALQDERYLRGMEAYGRRIHELTQPIWDERCALPVEEASPKRQKALQTDDR